MRRPRLRLAQLFGVAYCVVSQTNPHANPMAVCARPQAGRPAFSRMLRGRDAWRGGFLISTWLTWLLHDAIGHLSVIHELRLLPQIMDTDWSRLMLKVRVAPLAAR